MLGVGQRFGFGRRKVCIDTSLFAILAGSEIAEMFCVSSLDNLRRSELGSVALVPATLTILQVAVMFGGCDYLGFSRSELGMIAKADAFLAIGNVELASGGGDSSGFWRS